MTEVVHDAIVVGAGLSGLVAATRLAARGASVLVLEARSRVGGRTLSMPLGRGVADLGGQWLSPGQDRLAALVAELGVATFAQHRDGRMLVARDGSWLARVFEGAELGWRARQLDRASRRVPPGDPLAAARARDRDRLSLAAWLDERVRTRGARDMLALAAELHLGAPPDELSFLYFLHMLRTTSGLLGTARGAELRVVGGAQTLCRELAARLPGSARVRPGSAVTRIEDTPGGVRVHSGEAEHRAGYAILALAPPLIGRIHVTPDFSPARARLHRRMRLAPVIKAALAYDRPFWRRAGLSGEAYSPRGVVRAAVDHTSAGGAQPALLAFVVGREARALSGRPARERRAAVTAALVDLFGDAAGRVTAYADKDWPCDPWSAGCVAYLGPGETGACGVAAEPEGRIHFAGTETATRWAGYLDGAIEAGERAAAEVLARLGHAGA